MKMNLVRNGNEDYNEFLRGIEESFKRIKKVQIIKLFDNETDELIDEDDINLIGILEEEVIIFNFKDENNIMIIQFKNDEQFLRLSIAYEPVAY